MNIYFTNVMYLYTRVIQINVPNYCNFACKTNIVRFIFVIL